MFCEIQERRQERQQELLPPEALSGIVAFGKDYIAKTRTIVLSEATSLGKEFLLEMMDLPEDGVSWRSKPSSSTLGEIPCFDWRPSSEDSLENRTAYMTHLQNHVQMPAGYSIADVHRKRGLLNVEFKGTETVRRISGTTDVVIARTVHVANDAMRHNIEALFELKKPQSIQTKDHSAQVVCEHLAASYLSRRHAVVSVLTDLNLFWVFYWFAEQNDDSRVALCKLKLEANNEAARLAKYLVESLNDDSRRDYLPTSFVDRLSFDAVMDKLVEKRDQKRARKDGGGDGDGSHPQDQKPVGSQDQKPPSRTDDYSGDKRSQNSGGQDPDPGATDIASALLLFAPPSERDVANELDLLDMVDEDEQFEIIRAFAAKHIAPFTTGQY